MKWTIWILLFLINAVALNRAQASVLRNGNTTAMDLSKLWPNDYKEMVVSFTGPFPHIIRGPVVKGASIDVLNLLAQKFGFKYKLKAERGFDPIKIKGNVTMGVIPALVRGDSALGIGQMSLTFERMQMVDYLTPMSSYQLSFAYLKPKPVDSLFTLLRPFDAQVWLWLAIASLSLLGFIVVHDIIFNWGQLTASFEAFALALAIPLQESLPFRWLFRQRKQRWPIRAMLMVLWLLMAMVISLAYKSLLLARLTTVEYEKPVDSIQDLLDRNIRLTVNSATTMKTAMASSSRPLMRKLFEQAVLAKDGLFHNEPGNLIPRHITEARESGAAALATSRVKAESYGIYHVARDDYIMKTHSSWALPKRSPLMPLINPVLVALRESGILYKLEKDPVLATTKRNRIKKHLSGITDFDQEKVADKDQPLNFRQCQPIFLILGVGLLLSLVVFISERAYKLLTKGNTSNKDAITSLWAK